MPAQQGLALPLRRQISETCSDQLTHRVHDVLRRAADFTLTEGMQELPERMLSP